MTAIFQQFLGMNIPGLRHIISTRHGGVSSGGYSALNIAYHVGDNAEAVTENRRILAQAAGYPAEELIAAQQIHGDRLEWVGEKDKGRGAFNGAGAIADCDGLLVAENNTPVVIMVADCAPVLIVDQRKKMLAAVHAGWRGTVAGIVSAAIIELCNAGSNPVDIRLGIGPTLCINCFEVGEDTARQFTSRFGEKVVTQIAGKVHLNINASIIADAVSVGVTPAQITLCPACTRCKHSTFFSYRYQQGNAGRFALVAWWK